MELRDLVEKTLERRGCLVEVRDPRCVQVLFPPELRERLAVGEMEILCFDGAETAGGIGIHYGSDFLKKLAPLVAERGRFTVRIEETRAVFPRDPERVLAHNLALQNGIYRFKDLSVRWFSYLVVNFRVAALADTKSEALIAAVINEEAKTIPEGMEALLVRRFPGEKAGPGLPDITVPPVPTSMRRLKVLAGHKAVETFEDFLKSIRRRMGRDLKRIQEYYGTLAGEIETSLGKRKNDEAGARERAVSRLEATKIEYLKKIQDIRTKYAVEFELVPVNALRVYLESPVFRIDVQRRKNARALEIPWNSLTRSLERFACEKCFRSLTSVFLSDAMDVLCPSCQERQK